MNFNDVRNQVNRILIDHDRITTARSVKHPNSHIWELVTTYPIYRSVIEPLLNSVTDNDELAYDLKFEKLDSKPGEGIQYRYRIQLRLVTVEPDGEEE